MARDSIRVRKSAGGQNWNRQPLSAGLFELMGRAYCLRDMRRAWLAIGLLGMGMVALRAESDLADHTNLSEAPHRYYERSPRDRLSQIKEALESGRIPLDSSDEKAFLVSLLQALDIPTTSQMLVFSTTSLQLRLISPANPRALYFNEDIYLGYVPGGRIEVIAIDPELGPIFYMFDVPRTDRPLRLERSDRCMNCHAAAETRFIPGLLIKSVLPGARGGSLEAFRQEQLGHGVPLSERFGGWYLTGSGFTNHLGNRVGRASPDGFVKMPIDVERAFPAGRYPVSTSDLLPQLLHEHQAGFVNLIAEAAYRARTYRHIDGQQLSAAHDAELDRQALRLTRYLLFADEAKLPPGAVADSAFKKDFLKSRRTASGGRSLKDFDLETRLFRYRCSYMIYSTAFQGLPRDLKQRVYRFLRKALDGSDANFAYLPAEERRAIATILRETLPEFADESLIRVD